MHDDYDLRQEQLNKASLLSSKKFLENLLEKFITNVVCIYFLCRQVFYNLLTSNIDFEICLFVLDMCYIYRVSFAVWFLF